MQSTAESTAVRAAEYLDRVRAITAPIATAAPEIESARQLPPAVVKLLADAGMFATAVPESWGGLELDATSIAQGIEILAAADGSAAWCAMIGCDTGFASAFLEDSVGRELFADPTQATAFVVNPTGVAAPAEGGYVVTGRWTFASGSTHARVFALGCLAMTPTGPRMATTTRPEIRVVAIPSGSAQVIDTWTTTGVRGSGSHDVAVTDLFVPEERTFPLGKDTPRRDGPLHRWTGLFTTKLGAVPLGIARAAIDDVLAIAASKRTLGNMIAIAEQQWLQLEIANAEMKFGQARAFYYEAIRDVWAPLVRGEMPSLPLRARMHLANVGALERGLEIVDAMYRAAGSAAPYARGTLDRRLRDIHTIGQHVTFAAGPLSDAGKVFLGVPTPDALLLQG